MTKKYIQLKNRGIHVVTDVPFSEEDEEMRMIALGLNMQGILNELHADKEDIEKVADTIEELLDIVVVVHKQTKSVEFTLDEDFNDDDLKIIAKRKEFIVYGAVSSDYGLIYVAKMNNEGEFELL